ncbi:MULTISPECIES: hypothetical protein [Methylobacterium]|jgi:hypothetical protein|uniref:Glyoxalase n=1 Tax=Methylobacterium isbiliense TaxID=315478 RepID=A0ABQ4S628_9HYPH|nr:MULTISPECIES: hypothetical protein [Methylobacterium]MBY0298875.1 hypothetical protein [Methylobacterium sp.]MDN3622167.1 hypothetical protein [Methylobacterium isbiliense]GJD98544.1 hypothetical protein GMJLKIPL_0455 [Methylobacterium isbiliense]
MTGRDIAMVIAAVDQVSVSTVPDVGGPWGAKFFLVMDPASGSLMAR